MDTSVSWRLNILGFTFLLVVGLSESGAVTTTVTNSGNWSVAGNWNNGVPADGYDVVIPAGKSITNTSATASLDSLTNSGTLVFSGWDSVLTSAVVNVNGLITHLVNTDTAAPWVPDHRVAMVCSNLTVAVNASINVDAKGYMGTGGNTNGYGPGGGSYLSTGYGSGGGYGGAGAKAYNGALGGITYGVAEAPVEPGSSGSGGGAPSTGNGGGVVYINAAQGQVTVNGTITANGGKGLQSGSGDGSGGSVYIICKTFAGTNAGTNGLISADSGMSAVAYHASGGGGRIAVIYDVAAQSNLNLTARPGVLFSANTGYTSSYGRPGTLNFPDAGILSDTALGGQLVGFSSWAPGSLVLSNGILVLPPAFALTVATNMTVLKGLGIGTLEVSQAVVRVGGDLTVSNGGIVKYYAGTNSAATLEVGGSLALSSTGMMYVHSGLTNAMTNSCGALVSVGGDMTIGTGAWVYPVSDPTNGGSAFFRMQNLTISGGTNAGFNAVGLGYQTTSSWVKGTGPGAGTTSGGGGYGGKGGRGHTGSALGGAAYGASNAPVEPGSSGATDIGYGGGGGLVRIEAQKKVTLNGMIKVNGNDARQGYSYGGGGAGGGIYITCQTFGGTNGTLSAYGGGYCVSASGGGGGGGGRIAVRMDSGETNGIGVSVAGGAGAGLAGTEPGAAGTVVCVWKLPRIDNGSGASELSASSVCLNGNLTYTGQFATVVGVSWGTNDGDTVQADWSTNVWLGQRGLGALSNTVSGLSARTRYYYRYHATNDDGEVWAPLTTNFMTLGAPESADNGTGASNITDTSAMLSGTVTGGYPVPMAYFFWNTSDCGTNKTLWGHQLDGGSASNGSVSANLTGLLPNQTCYYRCYGSNMHGEVWAPASASFATLPPSLAIGDAVITRGPAGVDVGLVFPVTLSSISAVAVSVDFSTSNGLALAGSDYTTTNGTLTLPAGAVNGQIAVTIPGGNVDEWPSVDLYVTLSNLVNATFVDNQGHGTIMVTNDTPETKIWTGQGEWTSRTNWSAAGTLPSPADTVYIKSGTVTVSSVGVDVASLIISNGATLLFSDWGSNVRAGDVTIRNGATITHAVNTDTNGADGWQPDARVNITCTNLTIDAGGGISVDARGYKGTSGNTNGYGPGGGSYSGGSYGSGGGYGGSGANAYNGAPGGATYGLAAAPAEPGSSGSGGGTPSTGNGGGVVYIDATPGRVTVNGRITANGGKGLQSGSGDGSGGSIHIICNSFAGTHAGTNGIISADGGMSAVSYRASGGGGRIAVIYDTTAQGTLNLTAKPTVLFSANTGYLSSFGRPGSLYFPDASILPEALSGGQLAGFSSWSPGNLTISNGIFVLPPAFVLSVASNLTVSRGAGNGTLEMTKSVVQIGGDLAVSNGGIVRYYAGTNSAATLNVAGNLALSSTGSLYVYSGLSHPTAENCGALVNVGEDMMVGSGSWVYPSSDPTNGQSALFRMKDLILSDGTNAGFNAVGLGYQTTNGWTRGTGPGAGIISGGGGYGGKGGQGHHATAYGGPTYGSANTPVAPGSSGATESGYGSGGGLVRIEAQRKVTLNGVIKANGTDALQGRVYGGGGAGGGISILCFSFEGTNGTLLATGGGYCVSVAGGGGGGGGRIAVWMVSGETNGITVSVAGGVGTGAAGTESGAAGSLVWGLRLVSGAIYSIR